MKLRKRIRGKREYYYLEQSIRENGKVIKKEKYLGSEIPKNIDKLKEEFEKELKDNLIKKLERIKKNFQKEWKRLPKSIKQKELEELAIAFTYNTNAIEGSIITLEEVREIVEENVAPNKPLKDVKETEAHNEVFLKMLSKKEKLSSSLLKKWHREIFGETKREIAGKYRDYLVRVGSYIAPDWQDVDKMMKELILFVDKNLGKMNAVKLAGISHYRFESIHPFGDGNGRIGRLLMNYILWYSGYPMIIIEYKKRKSYYSAFNRGERGFVSYFIRRYLAVHKNRLE